LFAYAKAICVALTVGDRSNRVAPPLGGAAITEATQTGNTSHGNVRTILLTVRHFDIGTASGA
jgi:hypothetical protein